jgi:hypothetical protein
MNDEQFMSDLQGEDELGAVVRAHLYIEHFTDQIIQIVVAKPECLKPLNLDFSGKVNLLLALGVDPEIKKPLTVLAGLRNKFAHRPNYKLTKSETSNLYDALSTDDKNLVQSCYKSALLIANPKMQNIPKFKELSPKESFVFLALAVRGIIVSALNEIKSKNA